MITLEQIQEYITTATYEELSKIDFLTWVQMDSMNGIIEHNDDRSYNYVDSH